MDQCGKSHAVILQLTNNKNGFRCIQNKSLITINNAEFSTSIVYVSLKTVASYLEIGHIPYQY